MFLNTHHLYALTNLKCVPPQPSVSSSLSLEKLTSHSIIIEVDCSYNCPDYYCQLNFLHTYCNYLSIAPQPPHITVIQLWHFDVQTSHSLERTAGRSLEPHCQCWTTNSWFTLNIMEWLCWRKGQWSLLDGRCLNAWMRRERLWQKLQYNKMLGMRTLCSMPRWTLMWRFTVTPFPSHHAAPFEHRTPSSAWWPPHLFCHIVLWSTTIFLLIYHLHHGP